MDFIAIINSITAFFQSNLPASLAIVFLLTLLLYRKPKFFLIILFIVLVLVGVLYLISDVTSTGVYHKEKLINKEVIP
jgi:high-affinity Fe2+/Pb2+ permease